MFKELLINYERGNLEDDKLIKLASMIDVEISQDFIENEIFFGIGNKFDNSVYGTGKIYIFKNNSTNEFLLIDTYLLPADQFEMMKIGIRCKEEKYNCIKKILSECFEEESYRPIFENIIEFEDNRLQKISKQKEVELKLFQKNNIGPVNKVTIEVKNFK